MIKRITTLCLSLLFLSVQGQQSVKKYVINNLQVVNSIDDSTAGYADLQTLGDAMGDARVVMLGESDHGDAPTFLAKTRIIRYLVEEKGFDVVAFESDFFSFNVGWQAAGWKDSIPGRDMAIAHLRNNNHGVWGEAKECQLLFGYLADGMVARKIEVTGFDNQHHTSFSKEKFSSLFLSFLDSSRLLPAGSPGEISFKQRWAAFLPYFRNPVSYQAFSRNPDNNQAFDSAWQSIDSSLLHLHQLARLKYGASHFWVQELKNLAADCRQTSFHEEGIKSFLKGFDTRDEQMASNLQWLATYKYPHRKIIVWAANGHVNRKHVFSAFWLKNRVLVMGAYFTRDPLFKNTTYVLGFTSSQGKVGRLGDIHYDIEPDKKRSFEAWADGRDADYAFVDFKAFKDRRPRYDRRFFMKANMHSNRKRDWLHVFDGIFYIKDQYPVAREL